MGEAKGASNSGEVKRRTYQGLAWSSLFALIYSLIFWLAGETIVELLTEHGGIVDAALPYLGLMVLLPLLAHWCFLYDGVFVGLTRASAMRNTMIISALAVYFPVWFLTQEQGNVSLWYALLAFLLARGVTLAWSFYRLDKRNELAASQS